MTKLTLKLKDDTLAMFELAKRVKAGEGVEWSDSLASKLCFGHGEFVGNLRKWIGGNGGPSMQKMLDFEHFLIDNIGPEEHAKFLATLGLPAAAPAKKKTTKSAAPAPQPASDWD